MPPLNSRVADHPISPIFTDRWSPRAFTGEPLAEADLMTLFEAARWAPSSSNSQPWRFFHARRDTEMWPVFLGLLGDSNRIWAQNVGALVILASKTSVAVPGKEAPVALLSHSLDAGAAWAYLALQATISGFAAHGMLGFDRARTAIELEIPADYKVEIAIAIGRPGDPSTLPERLRARETPNDRVPMATLVREGKFRV